MTTHRLAATPSTTVDAFDRDAAPVLTIDPGDTVVVDTLDAHGLLERPTGPGLDGARMFPGSRGHCLTGPIAVRGTRAGDWLAIRIDAVTAGSWGWTNAAAVATRVPTRLGLTEADVTTLHWSISTDDEDGSTAARARTVIGGRTYAVPVRPFLGVIGTAPAEPGPHWTVPPRPEVGGNLDCRELVAGSALFLPVAVAGALLSVGDGHAAQGDGEVSGTAIECPMTTTLTIDLVTPEIPTLHAQTPGGLVTFGLSEDLDEAMGDALAAMVGWLGRRQDWDTATALAMASTAVDLRVTQVANYTWGVHAVLPPGAIEEQALEEQR